MTTRCILRLFAFLRGPEGLSLLNKRYVLESLRQGTYAVDLFSVWPILFPHSMASTLHEMAMNTSMHHEVNLQSDDEPGTEPQATNDQPSVSGFSDPEGDEDEPRPPGPAGYAHLAQFMTKTQHGMVRRYKELSLNEPALPPG